MTSWKEYVNVTATTSAIHMLPRSLWERWTAGQSADNIAFSGRYAEQNVSVLSVQDGDITGVLKNIV